MKYEGEQLRGLIRDARRRRRLVLALRGAAVCLCGAAATLLLTGWAAHRYRHAEAALLALRLGALFAFVAAAYFSLVRPLSRRITDARLARLIEERTPGADDRLVAAVEYSDGGCAARLRGPSSRGSGRRRPRGRAREPRRRGQPPPARGLRRGVARVPVVFVGVLKWGPRAVSEGVAQLVTPSSLAAAAAALRIKVKPGTARVPKGSDQEITATLAASTSEAVTFFSRPVGAEGPSAEWVGQPMEPAKTRGEFQFSHLQHTGADRVFRRVERRPLRSLQTRSGRSALRQTARPRAQLPVVHAHRPRRQSRTAATSPR